MFYMKELPPEQCAGFLQSPTTSDAAVLDSKYKILLWTIAEIQEARNGGKLSTVAIPK